MTPARGGPAELFLDCTQRESVLVLALSASAAEAPFVRRFDAQSAAGEGERLWIELEGLFDEAGIGPDALSGIAVATGPGGFTGLRVSIACAKAIAFARGIPAVGIPSAALFAASDAARGGRGPWLVALASKAGGAWVTTATTMQATMQATTGVDADGAAGSLRLDEGSVVAEEAFAVRAAGVAAQGGVLLADAHLDPSLSACAARAGIAVRGLSVDASAAQALMRGALARVVPSTGPVGAAARDRPGVAGSPFALEPLYAREPEAVTNWRLRHASRGT